jgi:hypothetical protein
MIIVIAAGAIAMIIVSIVIAVTSVTVSISGDGVLRCGHQKHSGSQ